MISFKISKKLRFADGPGELKINFSENQRGQRIVITGESGSGKTTLLRILAGLTQPESGSVVVEDDTWFDSRENISIPPQKRNVGMVFQNYALFPNMTVREQLLYANPDKENAEKLMRLIGLEKLWHSYPSQLSGGQKQRVALARSLALNPPIMLLDEPLSAVDMVMRKKLQNELIEIQKHYDMTMFIVSHDYDEIMRFADRVLILKAGKIVRDCKPSEEALSVLR